jgi:tetratricopeptide (TPR) repeat protein
MSMTRLLLLVILTLGARFLAQEESGNRAYRRGDYAAAAERYREALARSELSPRLQYNLGTALLRLDQPEAVERLVEALAAQSPELRARAFYNLGNALAQESSGEQPGAEGLRAAIEAYRRSLLLDPGPDDVRWNLELAMQRLEEAEQRAQMQGPEQRPDATPEGEGSGAEPQPQPGGDESTFPGASETRRPQGAAADALDEPLPRELAEQILRAVEERERALQREKLRQQRRRTRGPDW